MTRSEVVALVVGVSAVAYAMTATGNEHDYSKDRNKETGMNGNKMRAAEPWQARLDTEHESATRSTSRADSLAGTDPDGDLTVTVSRGTIRLFDYYLTTLGETDLAGVRARVATEVERQVPDRATAVLALFDRYTTYLEDLQHVHASSFDSYFARTLALQQHHFGADAEILFGEDNALAARFLASASTTPRSVP